ncbi:MAG: PfkB family carbohydrate kinase [Bacillota bacterium]
MPLEKNRISYTQKAKNRLDKIETKNLNQNVLFGFDGFIDNIWTLVSERNSVEDYKVMNSMLTLNQRIKDSAGGGLSTEILKKDKRAGGFNANTARVLNYLGINTTLLSLFGEKENDEVFKDIVKNSEIISLGDPCSAQIFEFEDGKLMFPNNEHIRKMDWQQLKDKVGLAKLIEIIDQADLLAFGYWSNMPYYDTIIKGIMEEVIPKIEARKRQMFMDFGNVKKRSNHDLAEFSKSLGALEEYFKLTVSLNRTETIDTAAALGIETELEKNNYQSIAKAIRKKMGISNFVVHTNSFALSVNDTGLQKLEQPYCQNPVVTTGAGDTFNGGYISAMTISDDPEIRLAAASSTAGYFIRNAEPPTIEQLKSFLGDYESLF